MLASGRRARRHIDVWPGYVDALQSGNADGNALPSVQEVTPVVFRCDAKNALAPLVHQHCFGKIINDSRIT